MVSLLLAWIDVQVSEHALYTNFNMLYFEYSERERSLDGSEISIQKLNIVSLYVIC